MDFEEFAKSKVPYSRDAVEVGLRLALGAVPPGETMWVVFAGGAIQLKRFPVCEHCRGAGYETPEVKP